MKKIIPAILLVLSLAGCASMVTFPDGKTMVFRKGFGMRNFEAKYRNGQTKDEYSAKGDSNFKLPDFNFLSLPK